MKKLPVRRIVASLAGLAVFLLFLKWVDMRQSLAVAGSADFTYILLVLLLGVVTTTLRGIRFYILAHSGGHGVRLSQSILATYAASSMALITPARIGETSKIGFLKRSRQLIPCVVMEKVLDASVQFLVAGLAIFSFPQYGRIYVVAIVALALVVLVLLKVRRVPDKIRKYLGEGLAQLHGNTQKTKRVCLLSVVLVTICIWMFGVLGQYTMATALGLHIPIVLLAQISALTIIIGSVSGLPGGLGVSQVTFTALAMHSTGIPKNELAILAIFLLGSAYLVSIVLGLSGILGLSIIKRKEKELQP